MVVLEQIAKDIVETAAETGTNGAQTVTAAAAAVADGAGAAPVNDRGVGFGVGHTECRASELEQTVATLRDVVRVVDQVHAHLQREGGDHEEARSTQLDALLSAGRGDATTTVTRHRRVV
ncbi:hypothetical protein [Nocardioides alkalitolerans]|uniref:hypothetical protein n=1 Tax=Nocardioides alkalitolerans TaxID=281714 RepID=UPI0012F89964|nr:hypothetical protein [Nocardioides alkalitolerans]